MLKMMGGFEVGKGVGKLNQGIVNPVEAVMQKKNQGLGEGTTSSSSTSEAISTKNLIAVEETLEEKQRREEK